MTDQGDNVHPGHITRKSSGTDNVHSGLHPSVT